MDDQPLNISISDIDDSLFFCEGCQILGLDGSM